MTRGKTTVQQDSQRWIKMSDDQLLELIGNALLSDEKGLLPKSVDEKIARARAWMEEKKDFLCELVCKDARVRRYLSAENFEADLTIIIIDILLEHSSKIAPVPAAATAALFCRYSYHRCCSRYW